MRRLLGEFRSSERHVCELMAVPRSSGRYRSRRDDSLVQERLRELAREHPRFGYRRLHLYLHKEMGVNHKKVQRVYRELGLTVKRTRRKHLRRTLQPRPVLTAPNQEWGFGLRQRGHGRWTAFPRPGRDRQFHPAASGIGGRYQLPQPARYPCTRTGDCSTRKAAIDSQ